MTKIPTFLTDPKPAPSIAPRPWKPMTRAKLKRIYGEAYARKVMALRTITERVKA